MTTNAHGKQTFAVICIATFQAARRSNWIGPLATHHLREGLQPRDDFASSPIEYGEGPRILLL
jgi:hypothetical protein